MCPVFKVSSFDIDPIVQALNSFDLMITSLTPFSSVVAGFPQFIDETNADWEMATDYILSQVSALTYSEWAIIEKIYDETTASMSN